MSPIRRRTIVLTLALGALLCLLPLAVPRAGQTPQQVQITLLGTTDLHGNLVPWDYYQNRAANRGLTKIATLIKQVRAEQPNTLLLDSGDTIQGTPLAYYFARKDTSKINPTVAVMNALKYDAMAAGNHEFNFGLPPLLKAKGEAKFPMLGANITWRGPRTAVEYFAPYVIKEIAGVRVGIVGFTNPGIPRWEVPENYRGYSFEDIVDSAKRVVPEVRQQVDLLVVIAHSGMERDIDRIRDNVSQLPNENVMNALAEQVPGIDVILYGHTHQETPQNIINGVLLAQARNWGQSLARADVTMERDAAGKWRVAAKRSTVLPVTDAVAADPEISEIARPYHEATQAYLDTPIAESTESLDGSRARYEDHPFVDLIHKVQMDASRADISFATMFLPTAKIPAGQVTVRQIASLYIYENTLYAVELTGAQVRDALEHAAGMFTDWPVPAGGRIALPGYNSDCAEGVSYEVDLTQPKGQRIRKLEYKGKPIDPAAKFRVAINNYRQSGGGRYAMLKEAPIVYRASTEVRDLMIEYVTRTKTIPTKANNNWRIVPLEAVDAMVAEATRPRTPQPPRAQ